MSAKGPELKVGDAIPGTKYRVVRSLGAGGMGVVYQVVKPPNIQGVLKLMSSELTQHEEHRMRFFDEVRILAQLDHPNIVKVFDYDALPDGTPFYVMELLSGRTVRDVIYTMGRVPPRVAYEITRQLLEALQAAHTHEVPVIHRDIKPENIFLHAPRHGEPVVKLIDFGVSAVADRKHDGAFVGTWSYAAPEQIRGEKPTPATDLYAAGLVLYEMLAGVGPFDHYDDWARVSEAQLKEIPAPVSKLAPWVPPSIVTLIQAALAKDPRVRPRDAYAFAERLFELEWASDGKDPHDMTAEGPSLSVPPRVAAGAGALAAPPFVGALRHARRDPHAGGAPVEVAGNGPLSRVLTSITSSAAPGRAPGKNMAAASPATDRLGDVPLIGVPPSSVHTGSTWRGVGGRDHTSPDADALLAGLGVAGGKPPSKRERESNPEADGGSARAGSALASPGAASDDDTATPPRLLDGRPDPDLGRGGATAITLDEIPPGAGAGPPARDTFSSQQSDARRAIPKSRTGLFVLAGAMVLAGVVTATIVVVRGDEPRKTDITATTGIMATAGTTGTIPGAVGPAAGDGGPAAEAAITETVPATSTSTHPPRGAQPAPSETASIGVTTQPSSTKPEQKAGPTPRPGAPKVAQTAAGNATRPPAAPATNTVNAGSSPAPAPKPSSSVDLIRSF